VGTFVALLGVCLVGSSPIAHAAEFAQNAESVLVAMLFSGMAMRANIDQLCVCRAR
jgi:hypothetical protein